MPDSQPLRDRPIIEQAREAVRERMIQLGWEDLAETHSAMDACDAAVLVVLEHLNERLTPYLEGRSNVDPVEVLQDLLADLLRECSS